MCIVCGLKGFGVRFLIPIILVTMPTPVVVAVVMTVVTAVVVVGVNIGPSSR